MGNNTTITYIFLLCLQTATDARKTKKIKTEKMSAAAPLGPGSKPGRVKGQRSKRDGTKRNEPRRGKGQGSKKNESGEGQGSKKNEPDEGQGSKRNKPGRDESRPQRRSARLQCKDLK